MIKSQIIHKTLKFTKIFKKVWIKMYSFNKKFINAIIERMSFCVSGTITTTGE